MVIADQKKRENIAEYVLYMWQLEDLMRSIDLKPENVGAIASQFTEYDESVVEAAEKWYKDMIRKMKAQKIEKTGHLMEVQDVVIELYYLHNTLLNISKDAKYLKLYEKASPHLTELRKKSGKVSNEIELCFNALYGLLLLRLQKMPVSPDTEAAMKTISDLTAFLASRYHQMKSGKMDFSQN